MKKVKISLMAFMLLASSNLNAQIDSGPVDPRLNFIIGPSIVDFPIDPGPIDPPGGPKPFTAGSIDGPGTVNCNQIETYVFSTPLGIRCRSFSWTVMYQDGRTEYRTGRSIDIDTGRDLGLIVIFGYARSCNSSYYYNAGKIVDVGIFMPKPSTLSGPPYLCNSTAGSYTTSAVSGAGHYTFYVPTGWKINGVLRTSFATSSRTVSITPPSTGRGTGQISVKAIPGRNVCGFASARRTKTVTYGRQAPLIIPSFTQVGTNSFVSFSVEGIDLSDYRWHIPNSWSALSGLNGPELIVVTGNTPGNYHVEVTARSCGVDVGDFVNITVNRDFVGGGFFATARGSNQFADYETINANDLTNEIDVYPNPVSRQLHLIVPNGATNLAAISMIDMSNGKQVLYKKMNNGSSVDLNNIQDGVYILNMITLSGQQIQKRIQVAH